MPITQNTRPEPTVDRNGKVTTVHKGRSTKAAANNRSASLLGAPSRVFGQPRGEKQNPILVSFRADIRESIGEDLGDGQVETLAGLAKHYVNNYDGVGDGYASEQEKEKAFSVLSRIANFGQEPAAPVVSESSSDKALTEFSDVLGEMIAHEDAKAMSYNKNIVANIDSGFAAIRTYKEVIDSICRQSVFRDFASKLRDMTDVGSEQQLAILDWQLASRSKNAVKAVQENPSQDSIAILSAISELQATIAMARFNARK